jgi:hypothetical protein
MPKAVWENTKGAAKSVFGGAGGTLGAFVGVPEFAKANDARIEA